MKGIAFLLSVLLAATALGSASAAAGKQVIKLAGGAGPLHIGVGFGSVWVTGRGTLYRINPRTDAKRAINVGSNLCALPQFAAGYVWVSACENEGTYQIDPRTNHVVRELRTIGIGAVGAGSLWFYDGGTGVVRLDPRSRLRLADIDPGVDVSSFGGPFLVSQGFVWVYGAGPDSQTAVSLIDVGTNKVVRVIPLPGGKQNGAETGGYFWGGFGAVAGGKVFVTDPAGVYVIDPASWTASLLPIKVTPFSASGDAAIVGTANDVFTRVSNGVVDELDASDGQVVHQYAASGGGGGLDVAYGSLWVANNAADSVWRYPVG
jgi:hypothetical protein